MQEDSAIKKVGVLGGTFDPVHLGHLALARFVRQALALEEFLFIPAPRPPHKRRGDLTPFADRLAMLRLALAAEPEFSVSDLEVARSGPSYSDDTLQDLHRLHGPAARFFFVIGLDAFLELRTWKDYRRLPRLADLVVINRTDYPEERALETVRQLGEYRPGPVPGCWQAVDHPGRVYLLAMAPVAISSTMVRRAVAAGQPLGELVAGPVADYIRRHGLYRS
jgi:nicotinate-nucleotide adenylyltransferase